MIAEWISVKDRLPNSPIDVLITLECEGTRSVAKAQFERFPSGLKGFSMSGGDWDASFAEPDFTRHGMGYGEHDTDPVVTITHWMPLPEPPAIDKASNA